MGRIAVRLELAPEKADGFGTGTLVDHNRRRDFNGRPNRRAKMRVGVERVILEGCDGQVVGVCGVLICLVELLGRECASSEPRQRFDPLARHTVDGSVLGESLLALRHTPAGDGRSHDGDDVSIDRLLGVC